MEINKYRESLDSLLVERKILQRDLTSNRTQYDELQVQIEELKTFSEVLQAASKLMYANLSVRLGNIITEGLTLVFPETDYRFAVEFVERRNQIETDLYLVDSEGNQYDPVHSVGGGITDFIALLLRITYIALSKSKKVIIADEPSKFISRDKIGDATKFLAKVCEDLGFDLIVVTHIPEMVEVSRKIYVVKKKGKISQIQERKMK